MSQRPLVIVSVTMMFFLAESQDFCTDTDGVLCHWEGKKLVELIIRNSSELQNLWDIPDWVGLNLNSLIWSDQLTIEKLTNGSGSIRFPKLRNLELTSTSLPRLFPSDLRSFPSLKSLKLRRNQLESVDWRSFRHHPLLQTVELAGNPLVCGCNLLWLKYYEQKLQARRSFPLPFQSDLKPQEVSVQNLTGLPQLFDLQEIFCKQENDNGIWSQVKVVHIADQNCSLPTAKFLPSDNNGFTSGHSLNYHCNITSGSSVRSTILFSSDKTKLSQMDKVAEGLYKVTINGNLTSALFGWLTCESSNDAMLDVDLVPVFPRDKPHLQQVYRKNQTGDLHETIYLEVLSVPPLQLNLSQNGRPVLIDNIQAEILFRTRTMQQFYSHKFHLLVKEPHNFQDIFSLEICNEYGCNRVIFTGQSLLFDLQPSTMTVVRYDGNPADGSWTTVIAVSVTLVLVLLLLSILTVLALRGRQWLKLRRTYRPCSIASTSTNGTSGELLGLTALGSAQVNDNLNYTDLSEVAIIPSTELSVARELGEGAFGKVFLVYWRKGDEKTPLAAKSLKQVSQQQICSFEKEAKLIATLDHPNIVRFFGISYNSSCALMLLFEYMEHGDLKDYLIEYGPNATHIGVISSRQLNEGELISAAVQVARGLAYLAGRFFVHRDIAARNCLVKGDLEVKIADFGMSRDVYFSDYYKVSKERALLPVRWLPPESLKLGKFTTESDVWSFGVLMFEIFSYGLQPWFQHSNAEVVSLILMGETLSPPDNCPTALAEIMKSCWRQNPSDRPKMSKICGELDSIYHNYAAKSPLIAKETDYVDVIA